MEKGNRLNISPIITTRVLPYKREQVFSAWSDPVLLAQWWGPAGFRNTIHAFEFREGGLWKFTMHGPDGTDYPNEMRFMEIDVPWRIVLYHLGPVHTFTATAVLEENGEGTSLRFSMVFDERSEQEKLKDLITAANEENLDRLEKVLTQLNKVLCQ